MRHRIDAARLLLPRLVGHPSVSHRSVLDGPAVVNQALYPVEGPGQRAVFVDDDSDRLHIRSLSDAFSGVSRVDPINVNAWYNMA
jgi:hypothetical protein